MKKNLYRTYVVARLSEANAEAISRFTRYFNSKGDCHAATVQERRLATTSIYEMYGREKITAFAGSDC